MNQIPARKVTYSKTQPPKNYPTITQICQVLGVTPLTKNTYQIELQSSPDTSLVYHAGQYLQLELDVNNNGQLQPLLYSIANSFNPVHPRRLELLIQNNSEFANSVLKCLSKIYDDKASVKVALPMGRAFLQTNLDLTHILIASGSGISKIKCLAEEILNQQPCADVNIYWSNKAASDFYLFETFEDWVTNNENFNFTPVLESNKSGWFGRSGYLYKVIEEDYRSIGSAQVYLCGSSKMVYGTIDKLKSSIGLSEENCYSDVFENAPRS